jgi:hypothetical protein
MNTCEPRAPIDINGAFGCGSRTSAQGGEPKKRDPKRMMIQIATKMPNEINKMSMSPSLAASMSSVG